MKKFYLLIMALVCYVTTTMAQPDPDCPINYFAIPYIVPGGPNYCKVVVGNGPIGDPGTDIRLFMYAPDGHLISDYNNSTSVFFLTVNGPVSTGNFNYACQTIEHIDVEYSVGGIIKTCTIKPLPAAPLPIKLSSFNGRLSTESEATIAWSSSMEENSFKYEVQRSADGKNFVTVGTITAAGTTLEGAKYSFKDVLPANGGYFYRLNMIDLDGKSEFSKVVYVNSKKGAGVVTKVFPSPFISEVQLIGATSADLTPNNIKVFSVTGQLIKYRIVGANAIAIDENAPKGVYILKVKDQTFKLSKQ
ncbi:MULTISPECIES: T9SS type A sorting domain-containing protein [Niastella]|uniref:T9SS type A sorting domain-containing protein n=1 Tax=Niastella soli TaxID=2821487 RepID=A0ABS3YSF1_9BACT|nr:T9SS type A sorting domain-containing protein [Niastella soli]MBO9200769.1 T9SS type A sorting domain-containing protein [Niastella soli]